MYKEDEADSLQTLDHNVPHRIPWGSRMLSRYRMRRVGRKAWLGLAIYVVVMYCALWIQLVDFLTGHDSFASGPTAEAVWNVLSVPAVLLPFGADWLGYPDLAESLFFVVPVTNAGIIALILHGSRRLAAHATNEETARHDI